MKLCPNCGAENDDREMFCECGHDFSLDGDEDITLVYDTPPDEGDIDDGVAI